MTGQHISFNYHLDGQRALTPRNALGVSEVGSLGLLDLLETQLGLLRPRPSKAERIVQYRNCLHQRDGEQRFYHRSFAVDPLGVAERLLDWRDEWMLHGWEGSLPDVAPRRLQDLADVEALAGAGVADNTGQRLLAVTHALERLRPDIAEITVAGPMASLPLRWQQVLAKLPAVEAEPLKAAGIGFLGLLQQQMQLAAAGEDTSPIQWQDDDTVWVVQAETRILADIWLGTQLAGTEHTLLVSSGDGARLDAVLAAANHPRQGLKDLSAFRPALQVLPLAMELLWQPLNLYALVQFLTHPVCPVPAYARRILAEKMADAPGIGGARWEHALERIAEHCGSERYAEAAEQITFWVEHQRFDTDAGVPVETVIERIARLAEFFQKRTGVQGTPQHYAYSAAHAQCKTCITSMEGLLSGGDTVIHPTQLQTLVAQATATGTANPLWPAEVGAVNLVSDPAAVMESAERVIWSSLNVPVLPSSAPWSAAEITALAKVGVRLPSPTERLSRVAASWLRPVLAARKQLVLVLPPPETEVHPVWQLIQAVVKDPVVLPLESLLRDGGRNLAPVQERVLPVRRRWWQLPAGVKIPFREQESFSSLEKLIFNPSQWLLQYPARLRASSVASLSSDFLLYGNLAHSLAQRFFERPDALTISAEAFAAWFTDGFEQLIDQEGAVLRMPGRGADLENLRHRLQNAMVVLRDAFARADICQVTAEEELLGHFAGGSLLGYADLALQTGRGEHAIIDMKWGGIKKYPGKLKDNRHLQLAIYAELMRQKTGTWPAIGYYILSEAALFVPDNTLFAGATAVPSASGQNTPQLWQRFQVHWRWRADQIQAGRVEVVLDGLEETEDSLPPEDAMTPELLNPAYNDYLALSGWEQES